jgi:transcriptional regulator with XRE-family HTH domain
MTSSFGNVLKEWRAVRRMSQLDLGSEADVSSRHISFLESGRSRPSRIMVLHLAETLAMPRGERNRLLTAAGFAPVYTAHDVSEPAMEPVHRAIARTLDRHDPYPGIVLDRHWQVVDANRGAVALFELMGVGPRPDMLGLFLNPDGLRTLVSNWPRVGYFMLSRLRTESVAVGGDEVLDAAIADLAADESIAPPETGPLPPTITIDLVVGDLTLSMFSTIAQFGSAEDLALADQRIELFFPADDSTGGFLRSLVHGGD